MLHFQYNLRELMDRLEAEGEIDGFIRDIFRFSMLLDEYYGIEETLFDQHIAAASKLKYLEEVVASHVGKYFSSFLAQLIQNNDINFYHLIQKKFVDLLEKEKGSDFVEVISSIALNKEQLDQIQKALEKVTGRVLYVYNSTSENLIGGFLVKLGERTIDLSLKRDLEKLKYTVLQG